MEVLDEKNPASQADSDAAHEAAGAASPAGEPAGDHASESEEESKKGMFSQENLAEDTRIPPDETSSSPIVDLGMVKKEILVTSDDKVAFIDAVVNNTRFERSYALFGGRISITMRSLTSEEVQALAAWTLKQGTEDPAGQIAGRHRKYLLAAQVAKYNGTEMPPLEDPLFSKLDKDGKTVVPPGWVDRCKFWDGLGSGIIQAVLQVLQEFDSKYATLCSKAEDENFWTPDTP